MGGILFNCDYIDTYQSDQEEEHQKCSSEHRVTIDVAIAHRGHGHD